MLDHIGFPVSDIEKSKEFYKKLLAPLGYELLMEYPEYKVAGFGVKNEHGPNANFWISEGPKNTGMHVAFRADDRKIVDNFYEAGIKAGGCCNGKPGLREYHPNYYGAFIHDPDGYNIEAVCHLPQQ